MQHGLKIANLASLLILCHIKMNLVLLSILIVSPSDFSFPYSSSASLISQSLKYSLSLFIPWKLIRYLNYELVSLS